MLTSSDDRESIDAVYEAGATDFEAKPLNPSLLPHRVRYLLRSSRNLRALRSSEWSLAEAQRLARLGSWTGEVGSFGMRWSDEMYRILDLEPSTKASLDLLLSRVHPEDRAEVAECLERSLAHGDAAELSHRIELPSGDVRHVHQRVQSGAGEVGFMSLAGTMQEVTEQVEAEERIRYLANYDSLTGLPNRRMFQGRLQRAIDSAKASGRTVALLFLDLDRFKLVNDTLGHGAGDLLLKTMGERFSENVRGSDLVGRVASPRERAEVSRLGGDEFTVLLTRIDSASDAGEIARRLIEAAAVPVDVEGRQVSVGASIGIAVYPQDGSDPETIMKNADAAMYQAKERGRNAFAFFAPGTNARALRELTLESRLRDAIERDELAIHYQPRVEVDSGRVSGFEALLRWEHPDLGCVMPGEFIPITETTGLIVPIGEWVLHHACAGLAAFRGRRLGELELSVNVSSLQFERSDLVAQVREALEASGLEPTQLEVEITESVLLRELADTCRSLEALRELGVRVALDDFGTGYSSLRYLMNLPVDTLKIDRCFVSRMHEDSRARGIVEAVIALGRGLDFRVVAEGVELPETLEMLAQAGCDQVQGYLHGRPGPLDAVAARLESLR
jgi:diguanylate cyclase (GGDEF)-like protein